MDEDRRLDNGCGIPVLHTRHPQAGRKRCLGTALVIAVDGSGSISDEEYQFQKTSIIAALLDVEVLELIRAQGCIAVSVVFWGSAKNAGARKRAGTKSTHPQMQ